MTEARLTSLQQQIVQQLTSGLSSAAIISAHKLTATGFEAILATIYYKTDTSSVEELTEWIIRN